MSRVFHTLAGAFALLLLSGGFVAEAQQVADSIRTQALRDYHGPDLEGKDGPLAKAGLDLLVLYHEYRAFEARDEETFSPSGTGLRVSEGRVTIDAIAAANVGELRSDLKDLGLQNAATAGRIVSGGLPIDQIPAMAQLESLRSATASRAETRENAPDPAVADSPAGAGPEAPRESTSVSESEAGSSTGASGTLMVLVGLIAILLLVELRSI